MKLFDAKPLEKHVLKFLAERRIEVTDEIVAGFNAAFSLRLADMYDKVACFEILIAILNRPQGAEACKRADAGPGERTAQARDGAAALE